jgi:hypothetical protein
MKYIINKGRLYLSFFIFQPQLNYVSEWHEYFYVFYVLHVSKEFLPNLNPNHPPGF